MVNRWQKKLQMLCWWNEKKKNTTFSHGFSRIKHRLIKQEIRIKTISHKATKNAKKKTEARKRDKRHLSSGRD